MNSFAFEAIGTSWRIDIIDTISSVRLKKIIKSIEERVELFDITYSRFRDDSVITEMSKKPGTYTLPSDAITLIGIYQKLYQITNGAFTPLIGDVLIDAGYDASYSLQSKKLRPTQTWNDVIEFNAPDLTLKKPAMLDFGAAGKGYLVDIIADILQENGLKSFCVDGSGDIYYQHADHIALQVGLEHPENPKQVIGIVTITQGSLCGSAGNKRQWEDYHHIIDPHTLTSPKDKLATWVYADTTIVADALTTCLFFVPAEKLQKYFNFEYVIVNKDFTIHKSRHFPAEFFYKNQ